MITHHSRASMAVDAALDHFFAERIDRARLVSPEYRRLWERIRAACDGGKRIRPQLLLLAHDALEGDAREDALAASVAFELLHTAFLLHDDVLDGDLVRRGRPNLQGAFVAEALDQALTADAATAWGDAAGVLAGDLLISAAHETIAATSDAVRPRLHALLDSCLFATAAGELADIGLAVGAVAPHAPTIVKMMQDKTAVYSFAAPLRAGALIAGACADIEAELVEIGTMLGLVYQLRDDLLGVFGSPTELGKSVDGDLREGKRTLLVSYAEGSEEWAAVRHLFGRRSLDADDADLLRTALIASGARRRAERELFAQCVRTSARIDESAVPPALRTDLLRLVQRCAERSS